MSEVFGILFLVVVAPIWIIAHYMTAWRRTKSLSQEEERLLDELRDAADRMQARIDNLEKILDAETPDWRRPGRED